MSVLYIYFSEHLQMFSLDTCLEVELLAYMNYIILKLLIATVILSSREFINFCPCCLYL